MKLYAGKTDRVCKYVGPPVPEDLCLPFLLQPPPCDGAFGRDSLCIDHEFYAPSEFGRILARLPDCLSLDAPTFPMLSVLLPTDVR